MKGNTISPIAKCIDVSIWSPKYNLSPSITRDIGYPNDRQIGIGASNSVIFRSSATTIGAKRCHIPIGITENHIIPSVAIYVADPDKGQILISTTYSEGPIKLAFGIKQHTFDVAIGPAKDDILLAISIDVAYKKGQLSGCNWSQRWIGNWRKRWCAADRNIL